MIWLHIIFSDFDYTSWSDWVLAILAAAGVLFLISMTFICLFGLFLGVHS